MPVSLRRLFRFAFAATATKWLILGGVVGLLCGLVGIAFHVVIDVVAHLVQDGLVGYRPSLPAGETHLLPPSEHAGPLRWWWLPLLLASGGLASGWLVQRFAPECAGPGTEGAVHAFHHERGRMRLRTAAVKFIASVLTLGTGGSAGREGPIAMVGAGLASGLAQRVGLSGRDCRILLAAGIAGGVAAIFRAPLAGALFAAEVLYSEADVESDVLIPSFISAIVAFCVFGMVEGGLYAHAAEGGELVTSLFLPPEGLSFSAGDALHLIGYLLVALAAVAGQRVVVAAVGVGGAAFERLPGPWCLRPALGGLLAGMVGLGVLAVTWWTGLVAPGGTQGLATIGAGYGIIQQALDGLTAAPGWSAVVLLLLVAAGKVVTSVCTVASGGSGGLFGPNIVIGACIGGAVGFALQGLPIAPPPAACVIMGMAGLFSAAYKTPIAALLMVSEMTGNYRLLLPAMWVCALCYLLSRGVRLVHSQVNSPIASPAHRGHFFSDILAGIRVSAVFDPMARPVQTLRPESGIDECKRLVAESHQTVYPVVDEGGRLTGIFNLNDLRSFLFDESLSLVAVAQDVATHDILTLQPRDSLAHALRHFTIKNVEELPVVADDDEGHYLGVLTRREVISHYNGVIEDLRAQRKAEGWEDPGSLSGTRPSGATQG
ncbi:MAG: chloride channel protein [Planctomycetota bacterium]|jgi:CIC family chloride channel protein